MPTFTELESMLVERTRLLLSAVTSGNYELYASLCDPTGTCIEPETSGQIIAGLVFHKFYIELSQAPTDAPPGPPRNTSISDVNVRIRGDMGYVTYNRVTQVGFVRTDVAQETRIWEKNAEGIWLLSHFHKSLTA